MKKVIKSILYSVLLLAIFFFYKTYFKKEDINTQSFNPETDINFKNDNNDNLIKNLRYNVNINKNFEYIIQSKSSEVFYKDDDDKEIVKMKKVKASISNIDKEILTINADKSSFDSRSYYTVFKNNIKIKYLDNIILADNAILDLEKKLILIEQNIRYDGIYGVLIADKIELNLITQNIEVFMNNSKNNIKIYTK